jgi:hypothetical protein
MPGSIANGSSRVYKNQDPYKVQSLLPLSYARSPLRARRSELRRTKAQASSEPYTDLDAVAQALGVF